MNVNINDLFQNTYRTPSTRILDKDYSFPGLYFITICTENRKIYFGKVENKKMILNSLGQAADKFWQQIPNHFNNVRLDEYIIMPNHIHGIIKIEYSDEWYKQKMTNVGRDAPWRVSTQEFRNKFGPLIKNSLSSIINHYKGDVKKWCNKNGYPYFRWQPRFYDHIIRNEDSLEDIRYYIRNNPYRWDEDRNNPKNL